MQAHDISMCHHPSKTNFGTSLYHKAKYVGSVMLSIAVLLRGQHGIGVCSQNMRNV